MITVLYALSFVMVVAGLGAIVTGSELIVLERGWSSVIAGTILATGGFIVFALALVLRELRNLPERLETAQYDYEAVPMVGTEPEYPEPPQSVAMGQSGLAPGMTPPLAPPMTPPIPAMPPLLTPAPVAPHVVSSPGISPPAAAPPIDSFAEELKSRLGAERADFKPGLGLVPDANEPPKPLFGDKPTLSEPPAADVKRSEHPDVAVPSRDMGLPRGTDIKPPEPPKAPEFPKAPTAAPFPSPFPPSVPSWAKPAGTEPAQAAAVPVDAPSEGFIRPPLGTGRDAMPRPGAPVTPTVVGVPAAGVGREPPPVVKTADLTSPETKIPETWPADIKPPESKPAEVKPFEVKPFEVKPFETRPPEAKIAEVKSSEVKIPEVKPREAGLSEPKLPEVLAPLSKAPEVKPPEVKSLDVKPSDVKPPDLKPVEAKPVEAKPVDVKPAEVKPAEVKPAEFKPAAVLPQVPPQPEPAATEEEEPTVVGTYSSGSNVYVMYSDGSIEADTPDGVFRFGSLDELKAFIASGEAPPVKDDKSGAVG